MEPLIDDFVLLTPESHCRHRNSSSSSSSVNAAKSHHRQLMPPKDMISSLTPGPNCLTSRTALVSALSSGAATLDPKPETLKSEA